MQSDEALRMQIDEVLELFNNLVSTKDPQVLAEFVPGDDVLLIGSDYGEIAKGRQPLEAFFARIFAREVTFSWEWERIEASQAGDLAWFFAEGQVVLSTTQEQRKSPYRVSGVLERHGERWLWRQYHGSEPVTGG
jgi:ketosteroid isomerase-like protein